MDEPKGTNYGGICSPVGCRFQHFICIRFIYEYKPWQILDELREHSC